MMGFLAVVLAYFIGGIPFGYVLVRLTTGKDVRAAGSGNIGATNVLRTTGRAAGVATLLLDVAKGYFAVWLAAKWSGDDALWMSLAALAVMAQACKVWSIARWRKTARGRRRPPTTKRKFIVFRSS
ncbi:MAG: glycerol-3-phosphate acyltransferase [Polyangiaceae bacterium]